MPIATNLSPDSGDKGDAMDLQRTLRRDWLLLNSGAARNALVAAADSQRRAAERAEAERTLQAAARAHEPGLLRAQ